MRKADARRFIAWPALRGVSAPEDDAERLSFSLSTRSERWERDVLSAPLELFEDRTDASRRSDRRGAGKSEDRKSVV